jgi:hypothetical protein
MSPGSGEGSAPQLERLGTSAPPGGEEGVVGHLNIPGVGESGTPQPLLEEENMAHITLTWRRRGWGQLYCTWRRRGRGAPKPQLVEKSFLTHKIFLFLFSPNTTKYPPPAPSASYQE